MTSDPSHPSFSAIFPLAPAAPERVGLGFTARGGGVSRAPYDSLDLATSTGDDPAAVATNLERVRSASGTSRIVCVTQVHGAEVIVVPPEHGTATIPAATSSSSSPVFGPSTKTVPGGADEPGGGRQRRSDDSGASQPPSWGRADALVTTRPSVALCIRVADCLPVLLADPAAGVIGAAHAGRAGLFAGVLENTVAAMRDAGASTITAWIGPHICGACYEVPPDMAQAGWKAIPATRAATRAGTAALDLGAGAEALLRAEGCRVHRHDPCTAEDAHFFSHRRDGPATGRSAGLIWLR